MEYDPLYGHFNEMSSKPLTRTDHKLLEKQQVVTETPALFEVLLLNDDYTPMEFVVTLLEQFFHKSAAEAHAIMLETHNQGQGHCGVFTREVAETKMIQVISASRECGYPLKCIINKTSN